MKNLVYWLVPTACLFLAAILVASGQEKSEANADPKPILPPLNPVDAQAIDAGLNWILNHQANDGRWSGQFPEHTRCDCKGMGKSREDVAATALGLLPLLAAGHTHKPGANGPDKFSKQIDGGLRFLLLLQQPDGMLSKHMQAQSQGTLALCRAYAQSGDAALAEPAQRAVNFLVKGQTDAGGWVETAGGKGYDTLIGAWAMSALVAAQQAKLDVPPEVSKNAVKWLDAAASPDGGRYGLRAPAGGDFLPVPSAAGLHARTYLGWGPRSPQMLAGSLTFRAHKPRANDIYFSYHATQVMLHLRGPVLAAWLPAMREEILKAQDKGDANQHQKGSWFAPNDPASAVGGRLAQSSLSLMVLQMSAKRMSPSE